MVIAGKEDFGNNLSNFGKKFLWSKVLTNLDRALLRPRPNDTIIYYYSNYDEPLPYHCYLPIYIHTTCRHYLLLYMYIGNIYIMIYMYMYIYVYVYVCVMLWCAMCRMMYVYTTLSSLALSSQPVCAWVGWHRCLTACTYAHIVQTIAPHLLSLLLLLYILYNIYTTTIDIPNMIFVYIILCHVKRLCYTPTLVYITLCYTMCIYMPYPTVIYDYVHNLTYYINIL